MAIKVSFDRKRWRSLPDPAKPAVETELPDTLPVQPVQEAPVQETTAQPEQPSYLDQYLESNRKPDPSDYHEGADWLATLTPPLSDEEVKRRARGARAVEGIGHLGNLISAFANVIYTGQGATPMTIPTVPSGQVDAWENRMCTLQNNYANAQQRAAAQDNASYQAALKAWRTGYNDAVKRDQDAAETARKKAADDAAAQDRKDKLALEREALEEKKRYHAAQEKTARQSAAASGGGSNDIIRIPKPGGGGYDEYRRRDLDNDAVVATIYQSLPDEYKVKDTKASIFSVQWDENNRPIYPEKTGVSKKEQIDQITRAINDGVLETFSEDIRVGTVNRKKDDTPIIYTPKDEIIDYIPNRK